MNSTVKGSSPAAWTDGEATSSSAAQSSAAAHADDGTRISLGQIKALIAPLSIDAAGLAQLGFPHVGTDKASKLYRASDLSAIRDAMVQHLLAIQIAELATA